MLTSDNGILNQARRAKEETKNEQEEEMRKLSILEAQTNLENYLYKDSSMGEEKEIVIPEKCVVSSKDDEKTLKDGLVIIDKNGNEWVWIEVPKTIYTTAKSSTDYSNIEKDMQTYAKFYRDEEKYLDIWLSEKEAGIKNEEEYNKLKNKMLKSVYEKGGFYIGRYEIGSFDEPVKSNDTKRKAVIQKGAYPYNYITCTQAQKIASDLNPTNNENYTSSLMFGIQWDLVCKYLEEKTDMSENDIKINSNLWGNYSSSRIIDLSGKFTKYEDNIGLGVWDIIPMNFIKEKGEKILFSTGVSEYVEKMNIYDFAGNLYEYTLESPIYNHYGYTCVGRGGYFGADNVLASRIWSFFA